MRNREWKIFKISDIFETLNGTNGIQMPTGAYINRKDLKKGKIPRITVKDTNNGVDSFSYSEHNNFRTYKNFISVSFLGSVFYHPYKASLDMKVHALILKNRKLNLYIAEFLKIMIKNNLKNSSYGNQLSSTDLPNVKIYLPVNENEAPDYDFMENYIKEIKRVTSKKYNDYVLGELQKLQKMSDNYLLENKNWSPILLSDLFEIKKGNQNNMAKLTKGKLPLVSAKKFDNGYKDFMSENGKEIFPANIITLNNDGDGGAGIAYYQPAEMLLDSHVTALIPKFDVANKYNLLFIAWAITKQREKFGHGYSLNNSRLKNFKFMIPVSKDGNVDFEYMQKYVAKKISLIMAKYEKYREDYK